MRMIPLSLLSRDAYNSGSGAPPPPSSPDEDDDDGTGEMGCGGGGAWLAAPEASALMVSPPALFASESAAGRGSVCMGVWV